MYTFFACNVIVHLWPLAKAIGQGVFMGIKSYLEETKPLVLERDETWDQFFKGKSRLALPDYFFY